MNIKGLQKLTILDYPGETAATIFTGGCNFRCPFCHNYELLSGRDDGGISETEVLYFLESRRKVLSGVVISGGEPTIQPDLDKFISKVKDLYFKVKLDTNGTRPDVIKRLISDGLIDYIAMDIKNSEDKYPLTIGMSDLPFKPIKESINLIMNSGIDYEFRTTVVSELHEENDFNFIGKMIKGAKNYYLQPFIDRETVPYAGLHSPSKEELNKYKEIMSNYVTNCEIRGV